MTIVNHTIVEQDLAWIQQSGLPFEKLNHKTIFISGANGFIPSFLVEFFLYLNEVNKSNISIVALCRNEAKAKKRFAQYLTRKDLKFICQDVVQPVNINEKIDYVIHAASQPSPKYYEIDPVGTILPNVVGTLNLLKLASSQQTSSFLFVSSSSVYGFSSQDGAKIKESYMGLVDSFNFYSCYAESKRMGETLCSSWMKQYNLPVQIIRPFHTFGPGMYLDDGKMLADFVANIVNKQDILIKGDGKSIRSYCYLADAILGILLIMLKGSYGEVYNLGNEDNLISAKDLAETMVNLFPDLSLKVKFSEPALVNKNYSRIDCVCPDTSKIRSLGWSPKFGIEDGFKRTLMSYL